jgi:hypothetical protein
MNIPSGIRQMCSLSTDRPQASPCGREQGSYALQGRGGKLFSAVHVVLGRTLNAHSGARSAGFGLPVMVFLSRAPVFSQQISHPSTADALAVGKAAAEACTPQTQPDQDTQVSSCPVQACSPLQGDSRRCVGRTLDNSPSLIQIAGTESKQAFQPTSLEREGR